MILVVCSVLVSVVLVALALSIIEREFARHWRQIVEALRFDPARYGPIDATPQAARRPALVTVRPTSPRRRPIAA